MDYSVDVSSQEIHLSDLQNGCPAIHFSPLHGRLSLGSVHQPQGEVTTFQKETFYLSSQVTASSYTPSDSQVWCLEL